MTLNDGTGNINSLFPARSAICWYNGTFFAAAPALQTAKETPNVQIRNIE
jgi:hypothetical protein